MKTIPFLITASLILMLTGCDTVQPHFSDDLEQPVSGVSSEWSDVALQVSDRNGNQGERQRDQDCEDREECDEDGKQRGHDGNHGNQDRQGNADRSGEHQRDQDCEDREECDEDGKQQSGGEQKRSGNS